MNEINVDLKSLVGEHKLSAVGFKEGTNCYCNDEPKKIMLFTLDKITYKATEDDNDGYRSCMGELVITNEKPEEQFKPIKVMCRHITKHVGGYGDEDDMLEFVDIKTGEIILEVGTENVGDYYPGFVATFHKERINMKNKECVQAEGKNHQGHFEISVSFDVYGKSKNMEVGEFVAYIENGMQDEFNKHLGNILNKDFEIKNIRWNQ